MELEPSERCRWLHCVVENPAAPLRLINFSWSGNRGGTGSDYTSKDWPKLAPIFEVHDVLLPGRGKRIGETPRQDLRSIVVDLAHALQTEISDRRPSVFLGFAFGAVIAFETIHEMLSRRPMSRPILLCAISAEGPEWDGRCTELLHKLSLAEFEEALRRKVQRRIAARARTCSRMQRAQIARPYGRVDLPRVSTRTAQTAPSNLTQGSTDPSMLDDC